MPKQILLADDSATIARMVQITFAHEDYVVTTVKSSDEALSRARQEKPDVILIDHALPGRSGYDTAQALRDAGIGDVPILLLTANIAPFDEGRAQRAGVDGHVPKPFETQALIDKVSSVASKGRATSPSLPAVTPQMPSPTAATPSGWAQRAPRPRDEWGETTKPDEGPSYTPTPASLPSLPKQQPVAPRATLMGFPAMAMPSDGPSPTPSKPTPPAPPPPRSQTGSRPAVAGTEDKTMLSMQAPVLPPGLMQSKPPLPPPPPAPQREKSGIHSIVSRNAGPVTEALKTLSSLTPPPQPAVQVPRPDAPPSPPKVEVASQLDVSSPLGVSLPMPSQAKAPPTPPVVEKKPEPPAPPAAHATEAPAQVHVEAKVEIPPPPAPPKAPEPVVAKHVEPPVVSTAHAPRGIPLDAPRMPRPPLIPNAPTPAPVVAKVEVPPAPPLTIEPATPPIAVEEAKPVAEVHVDKTEEPTLETVAPAPPAAPLETPLAPLAAAVAAAAAPAVASAASQALGGLAAKGPEYAAIAELSRDVIEKIAWEVVPELAEIIIKAELDRIVKERGWK